MPFAAAGLVGLGSLADVVVNAQQILDSTVRLVGSVILLSTWLGAGIWLRKRPTEWTLPQGDRFRLTRLVLTIHCAFAVALALLWIPCFLLPKSGERSSSDSTVSALSPSSTPTVVTQVGKLTEERDMGLWLKRPRGLVDCGEFNCAAPFGWGARAY